MPPRSLARNAYSATKLKLVGCKLQGKQTQSVPSSGIVGISVQKSCLSISSAAVALFRFGAIRLPLARQSSA
jgi:hypothetical protein